MPVSEPTTLVSDWVLAFAAFALGVRLHRTTIGGDGQAQRLWAAAFVAGGAGALAGGAVHGFAASLPPAAHAVLWRAALAGAGFAGSLVLAGTVVATFDGIWRRTFLAGVAAHLAVFLGLVSGRAETRHAVWNGALTIVVVLALTLTTASRDARRLAWVLLALGLSAAGLAAQRAGLAASVLSHNDVCHVLQTAALWPFYRAGRRLHDGDADRGLGGLCPDRAFGGTIGPLLPPGRQRFNYGGSHGTEGAVDGDGRDGARSPRGHEPDPGQAAGGGRSFSRRAGRHRVARRRRCAGGP